MLIRRGQAGAGGPPAKLPSRLRRLLHGFGVALFTLILFVLGGVGALAWRLAHGPLPMAFLARHLEAAANQPGSPVQLRVGGAAIAWEGWRHGVDWPLDIQLRDVRADGGGLQATAPRIDVSLSIAHLLIGRVMPRGLDVPAAQLVLVRAGDGALPPLLAGGGAPADGQIPWPSLVQEFGRPAGTDRFWGHRASRFSQLHRLRLHMAITVQDQALGTVWRVPDLSLDLAREAAGGVSGTAGAELLAGQVDAHLVATALLERGGAATALSVHLSPVDPARLGALAPQFAPLRGLDAPVAAAMTATFDPDWRVMDATLNAEAGAGSITVPGSTIPFTGFTLQARGNPRHLQLDHTVLVLPGTAGPSRVTLSGAGARDARGITARLDVGLDRMAAEDAKRFWPATIAANARDWITGNITAGKLHDADFKLSLAGSPDFTNLRLTDAKGRALAEDMTVHWLRPVPPADHGAGVLVLESPDVVHIDVTGARQGDGTPAGGIRVQNGTVRIDGLSVKDQNATIHLAAEGGLADAVALLRQPRLNLLSRHPVPINHPGGDFQGVLDVHLPLEKNLTIDEVAIHAQAALSDVHLGSVALGQDLDDAAIDLQASNDGLTLNGNGAIAHIPARFGASLDFRGGAANQVTEQISLAAQPTMRQVAAAGFDAGGIAGDVVTGPVGLTVDYRQQRSGAATAVIHADLQSGVLHVRQAGWSKPAGAPGSADATLRLNKDHLVGIDGLRAQAPGLLILGRAETGAGPGSVLDLQHVELGRTEATGRIRFPAQNGAPLRATISGPLLDLSGGWGAHDAAPSARPQKPGMPWSLDAQFGAVLLAEGRSVSGLTAQAQSDGRVVNRAAISTGGPEQMRIAITPDAGGRQLSAAAGDAGLLLHAFGMLHGLQGGALQIAARFDDTQPDHPLSGTATITNFRVRAPAVVRLAQAMTVYGLLNAAQGPGIGVSKLIAPFHLRGSELALNDARAFNAALGITARGWLDLDSETADLSGTIVPAYFFNTLLGQVPLLGRLFSPERGGGLFAATYTVGGKLDNPRVQVNPAAALAPGALRKLFGLD